AGIGKWALEGMETRAALVSQEALLQDSPDPYSLARDAYLQRQTKGVIVNVVCYNTVQDRSGIVSANSMVSGFTQSWAQELT
ncbi:MlaA family lipoprotein, partial [Vibrio cholerae]|uniref:MlaA family lipoprotein n=1 Tax=Vibrio cholerae TaxID=666 RepID=UPI003080A8D4